MHLINVGLLQTQGEQQVGWFYVTNLEIPFTAWPEPTGSAKPPAAMGWRHQLLGHQVVETTQVLRDHPESKGASMGSWGREQKSFWVLSSNHNITTDIL